MLKVNEESDSVTQRCSVKKVFCQILIFLWILQNFTEQLFYTDHLWTPLGDSKVDRAFHAFEIYKISTSSFWEFRGTNSFLKMALALRQLNPTHKKGP